MLARLGVSNIHGIGVFAASDIPAGTNVFPADQAEIVWVPANFSLLTVGWYVNEARPGEPPNLEPSDVFDLVAARDIDAGEELTMLYSSFSKAAR